MIYLWIPYKFRSKYKWWDNILEILTSPLLPRISFFSFPLHWHGWCFCVHCFKRVWWADIDSIIQAWTHSIDTYWAMVLMIKLWIMEPILFSGSVLLYWESEFKHDWDIGDRSFEEYGWYSSSFPWIVALHLASWQGSKAWGRSEESEEWSMCSPSKSPAQVARSWKGISKSQQTEQASSRFPSQDQNNPCAPKWWIEVTAELLGLQWVRWVGPTWVDNHRPNGKMAISADTRLDSVRISLCWDQHVLCHTPTCMVARFSVHPIELSYNPRERWGRVSNELRFSFCHPLESERQGSK